MGPSVLVSVANPGPGKVLAEMSGHENNGRCGNHSLGSVLKTSVCPMTLQFNTH